VRALPQVQAVEFEGLGHMGPITHSTVVNQVISRFLEQSNPSFRSLEFHSSNLL
jgi:pimeloyl-ACP methyl ester carboxylesterase